jgi:hypothetical protein
MDMLVEVDQEKYAPFIVHETSTKVLYVFMFKVLYGMLQSYLLHYKNVGKIMNKLNSKFIHLTLMLPIKWLKDDITQSLRILMILSQVM